MKDALLPVTMYSVTFYDTLVLPAEDMSPVLLLIDWGQGRRTHRVCVGGGGGIGRDRHTVSYTLTDKGRQAYKQTYNVILPEHFFY